MKILHLNLHKVYFDMILNGFKNIEYRDLTYYWLKRLSNIDEIIKSLKYKNSVPKDFKQFDKIIFSNGYSKTRRQIEIEHIKTIFDFGKSEFGTHPKIVYFAIHLGRILKTKNC